jgi:hypothetical protein
MSTDRDLKVPHQLATAPALSEGVEIRAADSKRQTAATALIVTKHSRSGQALPTTAGALQITHGASARSAAFCPVLLHHDGAVGAPGRDRAREAPLPSHPLPPNRDVAKLSPPRSAFETDCSFTSHPKCRSGRNASHLNRLRGWA